MTLSSDMNVMLDSLPEFSPNGALNWSRDRPVEEWEGVTVQDGRVVAIRFAEKLKVEDWGDDEAKAGLMLAGGRMPSSFGHLDALEVLCIEGAGLGGPIPPVLGNCRRLRGLHVSENEVVPRIPPNSLTAVNCAFLSSDGSRESLPVRRSRRNWAHSPNWRN